MPGVREHGPVSHERPAYTGAGKLPCRFGHPCVLVPSGVPAKSTVKLAAAVCGSMERAEELNLSSIAMPAISTGIFGFPKDPRRTHFL